MYPFKEGSFAVTNAWYVVGFSSEISRKPIQRTIVGKPMALYRKEDGTPVAVGGRCPHRHFPLGEGSLCGDDIVCGYHGIQFGADGKCTKIPAQEKVPGAYRIPAYPALEHGIWVFVWPGDPALADPSSLPDLKVIRFEGNGLEVREISSRLIDCRYQLLNDNLLDLSHLAFLHQNTIGSSQNATEPEQVSISDDGVLHTRRFLRDAEPSPAIRAGGYLGKTDGVFGMDFYAPGFHAGIGDVTVAQSEGEDGGRPLLTTRVFHCITPANRNTCYYFFASAKADWFEGEVEFLNKVIDEDVFASVEIEKLLATLEDENEPRELMIKSDHAAVEGRRMIQALMDREAAAKNA